MILGIDATSLVKNRTGIGNYVYPYLRWMVKENPNWKFILYSNQEIFFDEDSVIKRVSPFRRGPYWQNTHLNQMIKEDSLDIFWGPNGYIPVFLPNNIRAVITIHDFVYEYAPKTMPLLSYFARKLFQKFCIKRADAIIAISKITADDLFKLYKIPATAIVNPFSDPSIFYKEQLEVIREVKISYNLPDKYFLTLSTLEPRKNISVLIRAFVELKNMGINLPILVLVGGKGWLNNEIEALINDSEKKGFIKRLGYLPDEHLAALYSGAELFLMPSLYEGYGKPILEAQMSGVPVLHGDHHSMVEASGGLGVSIKTDLNAIKKALCDFEKGKLSVVCRLSSDISIGNNIKISGELLWKTLTGL
jgi:glycosyltransferase involved in cell wall biosynthesis